MWMGMKTRKRTAIERFDPVAMSKFVHNSIAV